MLRVVFLRAVFAVLAMLVIHVAPPVGRFALRTPVSDRDNLRGKNRSANVSRVGLCSAVLGSKLFGGGEERPPVA